MAVPTEYDADMTHATRRVVALLVLALALAPPAARAADYREQAELALKADLSLYKLRYSLHALRGAVVLLGGVLFIILALDDSHLSRPDSWLYRTFGEQGVQPAAMAFGGFLGLCGLVWMGFAVRGSTVGLRRYTERMRALMKI